MNSSFVSVNRLLATAQSGGMDEMLTSLDGLGGLDRQRARLVGLLQTFADLYGDRPVALFTVAGRSELSGNHTDHNHGCVIAASVSLDILCVAAPREDGIISIHNEGYGDTYVDTTTYTKADKEKFGTTDALVAGVCDGFKKNGYAIGGFDACTVSDVLQGSGLSSSAAFEDMVGTVLSHLYNDGGVDNVTVAKIGQYAENVFFGKPCGLMDQVACAVGGAVAIDFEDPSAPVVEAIPLDLTAAGYRLCIVNTGGNHADLTPDYAAIPGEMKAVAAVFGKSVLREVPEADVRNAIPTLRERVGDRAILRALHFYAENARVAKQKAALLRAAEAQDTAEREAALDDFFALVRASGCSSFVYLQNVYTTANVAEQGLSLALNICENLLSGERAAWRVHGGGFAGTVQAFVPARLVDTFAQTMNAAFGRNACLTLSVRSVGAARIF